MKKILLTLWAGIALYVPAALAVPQLINYQGQLADSTGAPLDTTVAMTFTINYAPTGGVPLWSETQPAVVVRNGLFAVQLGSVSYPLPDVFNVDTYLGIAIGSDAEMTPRQPINSVAHAYRVGTVDGASGGTIGGDVAVIGKGRFGVNSTNSGQGAFVAGQSSHADATYSSVTGGALNWALGGYSHVGGGQQNRAGDGGGANYQTVGGGLQNFANGLAATVGGGATDTASGQYAVVAGGAWNVASGTNASVGGGQSNTAAGWRSTIAGGEVNATPGSNATVGGGSGGTASGICSTVGGGNSNTASGGWTAVPGGSGNVASADLASVSGGYMNVAAGQRSTIAGGHTNRTTGMYSMVAGGIENQANGIASFAAGYRARANDPGSFVWSSTGVGTDSTASFGTFTFTARCAGGARFYTTQTGTAIGAELPANQTAWVALCDSTRKVRYGRVNTTDVLNRLLRVPIETWSYKADPGHITHMGPMAQDFYAQFRLGESDTTISTLDPDGVALAAIQELAKRTERMNTLENELAELRAQVQALLAERKMSQK